MVLEIFSFLTTLAILAFLGNGLFMLLFPEKIRTLKITKLENFAISTGLGFSFLMNYYYCVDLFTHGNLFIVVIIPLLIAVVLQLLVVIKKVRREFNNKWGEFYQNLRCRMHNVTNRSRKDYTQKWGKTTFFLSNQTTWILFSILAFFILIRIGLIFNESSAQFSWDPYEWVREILAFVKDPHISYETMDNYPQGFVIILGFFMFLYPDPSFTSQYFALKWFPFYNLILIIIFLYPIHRRLFKGKNVYFLIILAVVFQQFFTYRTISLYPSILTSLQFEIIILMFLIEDFPKPVLYFTMASLLFIHIVYAGMVWIFYFGYILLSKLFASIRKWRKGLPRFEQQNYKSISSSRNEQNSKFFWKLLAFSIPFILYFVSLTFRYSTTWYTSFLWHFQTLNVFALIFQLLFDFLQTLFNLLVYAGQKIIWLNSWGSVYYSVILVGLFIRFREIQPNTALFKFIQFAKITIVFTLIAHFLQVFAAILSPFSGNVVIDFFVGFVNTELWRASYERFFEITNIISTLFLICILEELRLRYFKKDKFSKILPHISRAKKKWNKTIVQVSIGFLICFTIVRPSYIYYEYPVPSSYAEGLLEFRDYLDARKEINRSIGYTSGDFSLVLFITNYFQSQNVTAFNCTELNSTIITDRFLENQSSLFNYLVITNLTINNWTEIYTAFSESSYTLFSAPFILILKTKYA